MRNVPVLRALYAIEAASIARNRMFLIMPDTAHSAFSLPPAGLLGAEIMTRADKLAEASEGGPGVTRLVCSPEQALAYEFIRGWMEAAGMTTRIDDVGNLIGRYEGEKPGLPALMTGSHQDTVRQGGRYDGMLGFLVPISAVGALNRAGVRLPFAIEILIFADEEGVRYSTSLFASQAIAGTFDMKVLEQVDENGISLRQALTDFGCNPDNIPQIRRQKHEALGFFEVHIEQGPVLEARDLPVGVVTAIAGADRLNLTVTGMAGHAGTVPMKQRHDALAAAAEMVLEVERVVGGHPGMVGTVGRLETLPGAINVIPGEVRFTIDLRGPEDTRRRALRAELLAALAAIAEKRGVSLSHTLIYEMPATPCSASMIAQVEAAVRSVGVEPLHLYSGAGHDTMAMADLTQVGMLFVRCDRGISHHPAESITAEDADVAARVWLNFALNFRTA
jgi:allantoate deiminase